MKAVLVALVAFAAAAVADKDCEADYILQDCLGSQKAILDSCGNNDWNCKCNQHINILTCFNNCPKDPEVHSWEGQKTIFCDYASRYPSSTTKVVAQTTTANTPAKTTGAKNEDASETVKDETSGTASGSAAAATKTDSGAADLAFNAGSMLAAVAAVVAAAL